MSRRRSGTPRVERGQGRAGGALRRGKAESGARTRGQSREEGTQPPERFHKAKRHHKRPKSGGGQRDTPRSEKPNRTKASDEGGVVEHEKGRLIFGIHPVSEMIQRDPDQIEEMWVLKREERDNAGNAKRSRLVEKAKDAGVLVRYRPRLFFDRQLPEHNHQGVILCCRDFVYAEFDDLLEWKEGQGPLLLLAGVQDAGNLGALLRSARAFGAHGVILGQRDSCRVTPAVVRASAGAADSLNVAQVRQLPLAIKALRDAGWWILGLTMAEQAIQDFDLIRPTVFVLGAEGKGLKPSLRKHCDALLSVPMVEGWDSLNVSVCGGIALYEWARQNR